MAIYNVAETTNISGKCFSFIYGDNIENGSVVKKGAIAEGEREIYTAGIPAKGDEVFLVANPAWSYKNEALSQNEDAYINVANKPFRVYDLLADHHDRFGVMSYGITPAQDAEEQDLEPAIGDYIGVDTTTVKLKNLGADAPDDAATRGFIGKIVDINNYGYPVDTGSAGTIDMTCKMVVIEVIKNETV